MSAARPGAVRGHGWHLPLLVAISVLYESRFLGHWLNPTDEGWPLYAAMQLHEGGVLYRDVFFVFPPGHLLSAWVAHALDPPGVVLARVFYAAFNVALCVAIYLLGRRLMPPSYALLGATLLALAAPLSHRAQLLFGYRYLVFSVLALLAFSRRLRTDQARWMFVAGCCAGIALCFRLTPAFAVSVGVGVAVMALGTDWRGWLRDWAGYAAGVLVVALPVVAWFASSVGLPTLWQEVVVRPVVMTDLQSLPVPDLRLPASLARDDIHDAWVAVLFRLVALLYAAYAVGLGRLWIRSLSGRRPFEHPLLLAVVLWGAIYYVRCLGRSDEPHLMSAIPPFCLLLGHATWASLRWLGRRGTLPAELRRPVAASVCVLLLGAWVILPGVDRPFVPGFRGSTPLEALDGAVSLRKEDWWHVIGPTLDEVHELAAPGETILDLSAVPLLYVLAERSGPGRQDILMPGTFLDEDEELAFVSLLEQAPPAVVLLREKPFDDDEARAVGRTAPRMMEWIARHYEAVGDPEDIVLFRRRELREFGPVLPGSESFTQTTDEWPYRSPLELWESNGADVAARLDLAPLDERHAIDATVRELVEELDSLQGVDLLLRFDGLETQVRWGPRCFAHPELGVSLDRRIRSAPGADTSELREALRFVLAHQHAHTLQFRNYTLESLAAPGNQGAVEAQADLLAGVLLAQNRAFAYRSRDGVKSDIERGVQLSKRLGHPPWREAGRPRHRERVRLTTLGFQAGVHYATLWACRVTVGEPGNLRHYREAVRTLARYRKDSPTLPSFEAETCQGEDAFDWTHRVAREATND